MRRPLGYVLAWLSATIVAVTGSWVGLQPLLAATSPELPAPLSASQLREAAPSPTPVPSPEPSRSPSPSPSPSTAPSSSAPPESESPPPEPPPQPLLPASTEWRELSDGRTYERTFVLRGGEVTFHASRREVRVVEETPNPGYEVAVNRWSRSSLILSFESVEHTSRIWVMWRNGPYAEVTETV